MGGVSNSNVNKWIQSDKFWKILSKLAHTLYNPITYILAITVEDNSFLRNCHFSEHSSS